MTTRAERFRQQQVCRVCLRPNEEVGQRGVRSMHYECRAMVDAGMTHEQVRTWIRGQRVLAHLDSYGTDLVPASRLVRELSMTERTVRETVDELAKAGQVQRFVAVPNGAGRSTFLYRRTPPRRAA